MVRQGLDASVSVHLMHAVDVINRGMVPLGVVPPAADARRNRSVILVLDHQLGYKASNFYLSDYVI